MFSSNPLIQYWWFHLPNLVLAALMYTVLGRIVLGIFFDASSQNYIWRFFVRLTDPVVRIVAMVTPKAVPPVVVLAFTAIWLLIARMLLLIMVASLGATPPTGVPGQ